MKSQDQILLEEAYGLVLNEGFKEWLKDKISEYPNFLTVSALTALTALTALGTIKQELEFKQIEQIVKASNLEDYRKLKKAHDDYSFTSPKNSYMRTQALDKLNSLVKEYKAKYEISN